MEYVVLKEEDIEKHQSTSTNQILQNDNEEDDEEEALSCYKKFLFTLKAPETKRQWPRRFQVFLDFLNLEGITIEDKAIRLYNIIQVKDTKWFEDRLIDFFTFENERVDKGELSPNTIKNYYKPVKLFCEISNIFVNWKLISRGVKSGNGIADDRPPSVVEIQKLVESSNDMRIKVIVSVMISSGIRVGSWDYLKWKHITPIQRKGETIGAKIECYNTKTKKWYYSFLTLEAYNYVKTYIDFRKSHGESITGESWLLRDTWKIKSQRFGNYLGLAAKPIQLKSSGIRTLINKAWKIHGIRGKAKDGKRFEFKNVHGFRKFFETECQKVMNPVNISYLMSHTTGVVQNYYRPKEEVLLQDYIKAIDLLTISEEHRLNKKILEFQEKDNYQKYIIDKKIKTLEDVITQITEKFETIESMKKIDRKLWELGMPDDKIDLYIQNGKEKRTLQEQIKDDVLKHKKNLLLKQEE